jgi:3-methyladenine DNA glycosylase AlkD
MHEKEFFIRKAIGWVLRDYSYAAPDAVERFLREHRDELSPLSYREGAKQLSKMGRQMS